ncbi:carbamoyltransferase HypF [Rhodothermus profundi]|uniref:Carbamoyltransferase n=1 Tax=Rhodothermus profundi TaxID=633813 RepID=A0A1M6RJY0_9BACT|nr:carbamoyltransferase HypF [Rhodothermus profundi]SHK32729.1 Hydrogenase maturation protein, carbamoyltransferase HypF [Rhodothermus profundi]
MRTATNRLMRWRLHVEGAVQGVGFRPFVYRLAHELGLTGWVRNDPRGVTIEVEGPAERLTRFRERLELMPPPAARIRRITCTAQPPRGDATFIIAASHSEGERQVFLLPDLATCSDCLRELFDPTNRRYRYPFINCTHCGPRFTIIERLPYDRPHTTMRRFRMCIRCQAEYDNPHDRRFHAQPNACPDCGPHLALWDRTGRVLAEQDEALRQAAEAIRAGHIVAVKGLGGFHLMVDARNEGAVRALRHRKGREAKPFALMYPSLEAVRAHAQVSTAEAATLTSPAAPIVLLPRTEASYEALAPSVAPGNPYLGIMLPYTPLHHLLLAELGFPVVATSGNRSEEPICTDESEALVRLHGLADLFLVHNRPIARYCDDSVVRFMDGRPVLLRRARGYAPLPVVLPDDWPEHPAQILAVGGHLKNTVALAARRTVWLSQHIGDLETAEARAAFMQVVKDFQHLYRRVPDVVVCDAHPDYASTHYACRLSRPVVPVQHHLAHVWACMAEHGLRPPVLGFAWDGTGYGPDGLVWGGESLLITAQRVERVAHLRPFQLPGGKAAIREPRRAALGLLYAWQGPDASFRSLLPPEAFTPTEQRLLLQLLERGLHAPWTTSIGRLFDAIAALLGLRLRNRFEGEAAMLLEFAAEQARHFGSPYPLALREQQGRIVLDWAPLLEALQTDCARGLPPETIARRFHEGLAATIVAVARRVGCATVVLSGGCFQNRLLTETTLRLLRAAGFCPYIHQEVPPGDGGLALGQVAALRWGLTLPATPANASRSHVSGRTR